MNNPLWESFELQRKNKKEDIFQVMKQVPVFESLSKKELTEVEKIIYQREYKKDEPIFREGDPGLGMYIIVEGAVEIVGEKNDGKKQILAVLEKGAFFGDLSLLDDAPRSASAIAVNNCSILGFFRPNLLELMNRKPNLGLKILFSLSKIVSERLRRTNEQLAKVKDELEELKNG